jgi:predicted alpha/beta hydrolase
MLHLVRTLSPESAMRKKRRCPVLLLPGLGSSGPNSYDLHPAVSLADWLADRGWDVWTADFRGNGRSDKASLLRGRSASWSIDDNVELDLPAMLHAVREASGVRSVHAVGHSMGGMILTRSLATSEATSDALRSCAMLGSGCFLQGSWWQRLEALALGAARLLWSIPAGTLLQLHSTVAFTRYVPWPVPPLAPCLQRHFRSPPVLSPSVPPCVAFGL